jgi:hypothetical protein
MQAPSEHLSNELRMAAVDNVAATEQSSGPAHLGQEGPATGQVDAAQAKPDVKPDVEARPAEEKLLAEAKPQAASPADKPDVEAAAEDQPPAAEAQPPAASPADAEPGTDVHAAPAEEQAAAPPTDEQVVFKLKELLAEVDLAVTTGGGTHTPPHSSTASPAWHRIQSEQRAPPAPSTRTTPPFCPT